MRLNRNRLWGFGQGHCCICCLAPSYSLDLRCRSHAGHTSLVDGQTRGRWESQCSTIPWYIKCQFRFSNTHSRTHNLTQCIDSKIWGFFSPILPHCRIPSLVFVWCMWFTVQAHISSHHVCRRKVSRAHSQSLNLLVYLPLYTLAHEEVWNLVWSLYP